MRTTVGSLRQQTALTDQDTPVVIVSDDDSLKDLQVVEFYPDLTDPGGKWVRTFKVKVKRRDGYPHGKANPHSQSP
jgi:hypothetical protein